MISMSRKIVLASVALAAMIAVVLGCSESQPVGGSQAVLALSSHNLSFTAFVSRNPEPVRQKVFVSNSGEGDLTFVANYSASWISLDPVGTDTIFVTVVSDVLPVGEYYDTIRVVSPEATNSPQIIEVHLTVLDWLTTSPDTLFFNALGGGANPPPDSFRVIKVGGGSVPFSATTPSSWLNLENEQGTTPATVIVHPDISSLTKGIIVDSVIIESDSLPEARAVIPCLVAISSWSTTMLSQSVTLKSLYFHDDDTGWASGFASSGQDFGFIYKTTDGGDNWSLQPLISGAQFGGITFTDSQHGWIAANKGRMFYSDDGGESWTPRNDLSVDSSQSLRRVTFVGTDTGWAVGTDGIVIRTIDGGTSWSPQTTATGYGLSGVSFVDNQTGWISGLNGTILHTTNGGLNWAQQTSNSIADLRDICFIDADHGWAVGSNGTILHTVNGGTTWASQNSGVVNQLWSVDFVNDSTGWAVGAGGLVLRTNDRGLSWMIQLTGTLNALFDVAFRDENLGWTVGDEGIVIRTASGGF